MRHLYYDDRMKNERVSLIAKLQVFGCRVHTILPITKCVLHSRDQDSENAKTFPTKMKIMLKRKDGLRSKGRIYISSLVPQNVDCSRPGSLRHPFLWEGSRLGWEVVPDPLQHICVRCSCVWRVSLHVSIKYVCVCIVCLWQVCVCTLCVWSNVCILSVCANSFALTEV